MPADESPHVHHGLAVRGGEAAHAHVVLHDGKASAREAEQHLAKVVLRQRNALAARAVEDVAGVSAREAMHEAHGVEALARGRVGIIEGVSEPVRHDEAGRLVALRGGQRTLRVAGLVQDLCESANAEALQEHRLQSQHGPAQVLLPQRLASLNHVPVHPRRLWRLLHILHGWYGLSRLPEAYARRDQCCWQCVRHFIALF